MQDNFQSTFSKPGELHSKLNFHTKREDLHPLGSHKHYAAKHQITYIKEQNLKGGVISTSGNAGICTGYFGKEMNVPVYVLINDDRPAGKIEELTQKCKYLYLSKKSARLTNYISAKHKLHNLRPSMDDIAVEGFEKLGRDIYNNPSNTEWEEIYTFVTSGASYIGIYNTYKKLLEINKLHKLPKLHTVTGIAGQFGIANSPRQKDIDRILKETGGQNFKVNETTLNEFKEKFPDLTKILSDESLSSLTAAQSNNANSQSLVISTGKRWSIQNSNFNISTLPRLDTFEDCDKLFS